MATVGEEIKGCTGTGTSEDPYIFSTWEGFYNAINVSNAYVAGDTTTPPQERIIDMNEQLPDGLNNSINFKCTRIDGNDWSIYNLYIQSNYIFMPEYDFTIYNLNFLNLYQFYSGSSETCCFMGNRGKGGSHYNYFYNCKFSMLLNCSETGTNWIFGQYYSNGASLTRSCFRYNNCSFNVKMLNTPDYIFNDSYSIHNNCNYKFTFMKGGSDSYIFHANGGSWSNCKFLINTTGHTLYSIFSTAYTTVGTFYSCYFNFMSYVDTNSHTTQKSKFTYFSQNNPYMGTLCLFNVTNLYGVDFGTGKINTITNCTAILDSDITPEYIASTGFPILIEGD